MTESRQYDIVLYGATGYTGKYTAEYLQQYAPTNLNWAIAGRNQGKLSTLANELESLNKDRKQPVIEVVNHTPDELATLSGKSKVLISTVGPFAIYGTPVIEACLQTSTHYLDITGEVPWVYDMIQKFHKQAQEKHIILMLQCGNDSVPSDMTTYALVQHAHTHHNEGLRTVINTIQSLRGSFSGGTMASAMGLYAQYPLRFLLRTTSPFALSPTTPSATQRANSASPVPRSLVSSLTGTAHVPDLGYLGEWMGTIMDRAIVHRSWGLFDGGALYGRDFQFTQLLRARGYVDGAIRAYALGLGQLLMLSAPGRWLLRKFLYEPGDGPSREQAKDFGLKTKTIATTESGRKIVAKLDLKGCLYLFTGVFVAEAALEILSGKDNKAAREGGVMTSACLEDGYLERIKNAPGVTMTVEDMQSTARL